MSAARARLAAHPAAPYACPPFALHLSWCPHRSAVVSAVTPAGCDSPGPLGCADPQLPQLPPRPRARPAASPVQPFAASAGPIHAHVALHISLLGPACGLCARQQPRQLWSVLATVISLHPRRSHCALLPAPPPSPSAAVHDTWPRLLEGRLRACPPLLGLRPGRKLLSRAATQPTATEPGPLPLPPSPSSPAPDQYMLMLLYISLSLAPHAGCTPASGLGGLRSLLATLISLHPRCPRRALNASAAAFTFHCCIHGMAASPRALLALLRATAPGPAAAVVQCVSQRRALECSCSGLRVFGWCAFTPLRGASADT